MADSRNGDERGADSQRPMIGDMRPYLLVSRYRRRIPSHFSRIYRSQAPQFLGMSITGLVFGLLLTGLFNWNGGTLAYALLPVLFLAVTLETRHITRAFASRGVLDSLMGTPDGPAQVFVNLIWSQFVLWLRAFVVSAVIICFYGALISGSTRTLTLLLEYWNWVFVLWVFALGFVLAGISFGARWGLRAVNIRRAMFKVAKGVALLLFIAGGFLFVSYLIIRFTGNDLHPSFAPVSVLLMLPLLFVLLIASQIKKGSAAGPAGAPDHSSDEYPDPELDEVNQKGSID